MNNNNNNNIRWHFKNTQNRVSFTFSFTFPPTNHTSHTLTMVSGNETAEYGNTLPITPKERNSNKQPLRGKTSTVKRINIGLDRFPFGLLSLPFLNSPQANLESLPRACLTLAYRSPFYALLR